MGGRNWKKLNIRGDSYDPSQPKNQYLYNSRNLEGQNQSQHTVLKDKKIISLKICPS